MNRMSFKDIRSLGNEFAKSHPLEHSLLGDHPYILNNTFAENDQSQDFEVAAPVTGKTLFISSFYGEECLDSLTKKIIDSFKFETDKIEHLTLSNKSDIVGIIRMKKPSLIVFFGDLQLEIGSFKDLEYKAGLFKQDIKIGDFTMSCASLWSAKELHSDPRLKKSAWTLIQQVSNSSK